MTDGYLSKDREHIAGRQRQRRARMARIDYYPSPDALALIESRRTRYGPTNNNSGILDTIIAELAVLTGLKQSEVDRPITPAKPPELSDQYARTRMTSDDTTMLAGLHTCTSPRTPDLPDASRAHAGARATSVTPEYLPASQAREGANNSCSLLARNKANQARVICGAKRRRDGQPCQALSVPGKRRCKWHGGASTGPRTITGRDRALSNLIQYRDWPSIDT